MEKFKSLSTMNLSDLPVKELLRIVSKKLMLPLASLIWLIFRITHMGMPTLLEPKVTINSLASMELLNANGTKLKHVDSISSKTNSSNLTLSNALKRTTIKVLVLFTTMILLISALLKLVLLTLKQSPISKFVELMIQEITGNGKFLKQLMLWTLLILMFLT